MSLTPFWTLLAHPCPAFVCAPSADPSHTRQWVVRLRHIPNPPASNAELRRIEAIRAPGAAAALAFYRTFDGGVLYQDADSPLLPDGFYAGIILYPVREWARGQKHLPGIFPDAAARLPFRLADAVPIGEVPLSGNVFVWVTRGPKAGEVYFLHQDPEHLRRRPFARRIDLFFARLARDPVALLTYDLGCCVCYYAPGDHETQWVPFHYVPDYWRLDVEELRLNRLAGLEPNGEA